MQKNWELTCKTEPTATPRDFGCQTETSKIYYRIVCCCFQNEYSPYSEKGCGGELLLYSYSTLLLLYFYFYSTSTHDSWHHNIHVTIKSQLKVIKLTNPNLLQVCISSLLPLYHFSHTDTVSSYNQAHLKILLHSFRVLWRVCETVKSPPWNQQMY